MIKITGASVLYEGKLQDLEVLFDETGILKVAPVIEADAQVIDAEGLTLLPGLVDVHVHLRDPGFTEKETIRTGTMAAARGGFTTIFAMPNVRPCPDSVETAQPYRERLFQEGIVRVFPYGTITRGEQGRELTDYEALKALGIRWFSDDGVGVADEDVMRRAQEKASQAGVMLCCHTENMAYRTAGACVHASQVFAETGWAGIPSACEYTQLDRDLRLAHETGARYHACHISCRESCEALQAAKERGADVSGEVTAHHLLLEDADVKGPDWKMNPPLRSHEDRMALIRALEEGSLDFIASDHAPHTRADKDKPMAHASFGVVSLETSFAALYTEFVVREKRWTLPQLVAWMSEKPARRFGLERTGKIAEGYRSDLALFDLRAERVIHKNEFASKGKNTPFEGWCVNARTVRTIVGGRTVYKEEA